MISYSSVLQKDADCFLCPYPTVQWIKSAAGQGWEWSSNCASSVWSQTRPEQDPGAPGSTPPKKPFLYPCCQLLWRQSNNRAVRGIKAPECDGCRAGAEENLSFLFPHLRAAAGGLELRGGAHIQLSDRHRAGLRQVFERLTQQNPVSSCWFSIHTIFILFI